ncbi:MAG: PQQ-binding-like beta-propeller repeat protein [Litoreibacter sp.]
MTDYAGQAVNTLRNAKTGLTLCAIAAGLAACGANDELVLDGPRFDVRESVPSLTEDGTASEPESRAKTFVARGFNAPQQVNHSAWTHRNGNAEHSLAHPALGANITQVWSSAIGQGNGRKARITADPVVSGGRIFTLDSASQVVATGSDGASLWSQKLIPATDKDSEASGGGLAFGDGLVIAATGFGELFALDATSGEIKWRQKLEAPVTSAPTIAGGLVYVVTRDSRAWAITADNGRIKWQLPGTPSPTVIIGGAGAAISDRLAIFPFGSGEIASALKSSGIRVWGSSVAGQRRGRAYSNIGDVTGDPVISGDKIFASNQGGRTVALSVGGGERLWTVKEGALAPVWAAGDSVFMVSDQQNLLRLDAETGETIWSRALPQFTANKIKRRQDIFAHHGPVLAGGRLLVASDDGLIRSFNPETGDLIGTVDIPGGAASNPVIVNRTLYIVTTKGNLVAFR